MEKAGRARGKGSLGDELLPGIIQRLRKANCVLEAELGGVIGRAVKRFMATCPSAIELTVYVVSIYGRCL